MTSLNKFCISLIIVIVLISFSAEANKYSEKANKPKPKTIFSYPENIKELRQLEKPFRMHKLNLVWTKAKHRLTDPKLQSLFSDLKLHDKEQLAFKHLKADGKDDNGLEEARLRKKLKGIMITYDLLEHFEKFDYNEDFTKKKPFKNTNYQAKNVFKDKRLNKLWAKAEHGGFTNEELNALKEEFNHHQDKIDEYLSLLEEVKEGDPKKHQNSLDEDHFSFNEIEMEEEELLTNDIPGRKTDNFLSKTNMLREKHLEVRSGFDHLEGITAQGPEHKEFVEPKVQRLWRIANESQFSHQELASLKEELHHYEKRLMKLRHLHTEAALEAARQGKEYKKNATHETHIKRHAENVEKLHKEIESRIMEKREEL